MDTSSNAADWIVKEFDVTKDSLPRFLAGSGDTIPEVVETFGFESSPKAFHHGVVVEMPPFSSHYYTVFVSGN